MNFITTRDRARIYTEYKNAIERIYGPRGYMDRVLSTTRRLNLKFRHQPNAWEWKRNLRGLAHTAWWMLTHRDVRWLYLRNSWLTLWMGINKFDYAQQMMSLYMHFARQTEVVKNQLDVNIDFAMHHAPYPRMLDLPQKEETLTT